MSRQIPVTLTNMCMIRNGSRVLVQDRLDPDWPGIIFPGGHVESGESFCAAVIREVKEETGLTIHHPRLRGLKEWENADGSRYIVLFYETDQFSGELRPSEEGPVFWVELADLPNMKLSTDFEHMLRVFLDDTLSEAYYHKTHTGWEQQLL